jgi:hypothetical protein
MPTSQEGVALEIYGLSVRIEGDWPEVIEDLARDFAWFARIADRSPQVVVTIARRKPDLDRFGEVPQAFITSRNTVFQSGERTIVDYSGRVLAVYDRARDDFQVEGKERDLVH